MEANHFDPRSLEGIYSFDKDHNPNAGDGHFSRAPNEFIDYIFIRSKTLKPEASHLAYTSSFPSRKGPLFLSDHYAVESTFRTPSEEPATLEISAEPREWNLPRNCASKSTYPDCRPDLHFDSNPLRNLARESRPMVRL